MIGYLRGEALTADTLLVGGVGYQVHTAHPLRTGDETELWVKTTVHDGAVSLYGFTTQTEKAVFDTLTQVPGVGPSVALSLLRDVGTAGIVDALTRKNPAGLHAAKGVGPKLADKIVALAKPPEGVDAHTDEETGAEIIDLADVLESLGWNRGEALEAARAGIRNGDDETAQMAGALNHLRQNHAG